MNKKNTKIMFLITVIISVLVILIFVFIVFNVRNAHGQARVNAPGWEKGDMWNYQRLGKSGKVGFYHALTVLGRSVFQGKRGYKLELKVCNSEGEVNKDFSNDFLHFSADIQHLGVEQADGKIEGPLRHQFKIEWPLYDGKSWQWTAYDLIYEQNITYAYKTSFENIVVLAGEFECYKITREWKYKDKVFSETNYYSPKVKNFVKTLSTLGANDELVNYNLSK
jgi:hypothetical protein